MRSYTDLSGRIVDGPPSEPVTWRVSCYPIIVRDGSVLLVEPVWANRWELPGGGVELEREETLVEAAARECLEESGYRVEIDPARLRFLREDFFSVAVSGAYWHTLLFTVMGTVVADPPAGRAPVAEEIPRVAWVPVDTLTVDQIHAPHWQALVDRALVAS